MTSWKDMFEIDSPRWGEQWIVLFKADKKVLGRYGSGKYARNRAKYHFKKNMKKIDKILLGNLSGDGRPSHKAHN